jgi:hypothetical protein
MLRRLAPPALVILLMLAAIWVLQRPPPTPDVDARGRELWREAEAGLCHAGLSPTRGDVVAEGPAITGAGACGIDRPLLVHTLAIPISGAVAAGRIAPVTLGGAQPLSCPLAEATRQWLMESVQPAAMQHFRQPVRALRTLGSYSCRPINAGREEETSGRLSEHAFANALDVAAFVLSDGREVSLLRDWSGDAVRAAFLRDARDGACKAFRTTLGPDYNALHRDHFHLDMARRPFGAVCR